MSNWNKETAPQEHQTLDSRVNASPGCGATMLSSLGTSFSICLVTDKLWHYYMVELFQHGLDAGVGLMAIYLFEFPIIFVSAVIIWQTIGRLSSTHRNTERWLVSLLIGLIAGYLILLAASNNWRTESYAAFVNTQGLILLGYPSFSLGVYTIALATLRFR